MSVDGWISGGFEVTEYAESGEVSNCQGETGDVICVFWRAAYTDYTVSVEDLCTLEPTFETVLSSPNANGLGSTYLCAKNHQCVNEGYEFWNTSESCPLSLLDFLRGLLWVVMGWCVG